MSTSSPARWPYLVVALGASLGAVIALVTRFAPLDNDAIPLAIATGAWLVMGLGRMHTADGKAAMAGCFAAASLTLAILLGAPIGPFAAWAFSIGIAVLVGPMWSEGPLPFRLLFGPALLMVVVWPGAGLVAVAVTLAMLVVDMTASAIRPPAAQPS